MIFLTLAVLCLSCINIGFAVGNQRGCDHLHLCFSNYLAATVGAFILLMISPPQIYSFDNQALILNIKGQLTPSGSLSFSIVFGIITGFIYLGSLIITQFTVSKSGAGATTMFQRLGIIVPILVSIVIFKEIPTVIQITGIVLSAFSLILLGSTKVGHFKWLILTFIMGGMSELTNKIYQECSLPQYKPLFLFLVFLVCLIVSCVLIGVKYRKSRIRPFEILLGAGIGILNLSQAGLVIYSLQQLPAAVVFPVLSAGTILLTTAISAIFFQERITTRMKIGIGIILVSFILLNV